MGQDVVQLHLVLFSVLHLDLDGGICKCWRVVLHLHQTTLSARLLKITSTPTANLSWLPSMSAHAKCRTLRYR